MYRIAVIHWLFSLPVTQQRQKARPPTDKTFHVYKRLPGERRIDTREARPTFRGVISFLPPFIDLSPPPPSLFVLNIYKQAPLVSSCYCCYLRGSTE